VRLSDLSDTTADAVRNAGAFVTDLMTPSIRLGVTGFARSGKTVFITALVRNLIAGACPSSRRWRRAASGAPTWSLSPTTRSRASPMKSI
jgi:YcjX-like family, DUF463